METRTVADKARIIVAKDMTNSEIVFLLNALYKKNRLTYTHSINVGYITAQICIELKVDKRTATQVVRGALLHDIGKLFVPAEILTKKTSLSDAEFDKIKQHTEYGVLLLNNLVPSLSSDIIVDIVRDHHEKPDGTGYKKKTDVSYFAQLVHAVDIYDAITSDRPYRSFGSFPAAYGIEVLQEEGVNSSFVDVIKNCLVK